jgi:hypothetical protein
MKKNLVLTGVGLVLGATCCTQASVIYDFFDKASVFDGNTSVAVTLYDGTTPVEMTVSATGGNLNSNAEDFGIGDDLIDGTLEVLTLSFDKKIELNYIDLGAVGSDRSDGARLTVGSASPVDLYTGVDGFNGSSDIYTPSSPLPVEITESITLTGSEATSSFDLESMQITVIPEPAALTLTALGLLGAGLLRRLQA